VCLCVVCVCLCVCVEIALEIERGECESITNLCRYHVSLCSDLGVCACVWCVCVCVWCVCVCVCACGDCTGDLAW